MQFGFFMRARYFHSAIAFLVMEIINLKQRGKYRRKKKAVVVELGALRHFIHDSQLNAGLPLASFGSPERASAALSNLQAHYSKVVSAWQTSRPTEIHCPWRPTASLLNRSGFRTSIRTAVGSQQNIIDNVSSTDDPSHSRKPLSRSAISAGVYLRRKQRTGWYYCAKLSMP